MALYANGRDALGICDICGFQYKLRKLKGLVRNARQTNLKACPQCWEKDHPQNQLGRYRIEDAQAIRDPRPDTAEYASARSIKITAPTATGMAFLGATPVTVS